VIKKCLTCKKEFTTFPCFIKIGQGKFCSSKCYGKSLKGTHCGIKTEFKKGLVPWNRGKKFPQLSRENNRNWKGGRHLCKNGYIVLIVSNHPFADKFGRIYEHRFIMEKTLGRYLKPTEHIHHINGIKTDNKPENLQLFKSNSEHKKFHAMLLKRNAKLS
jgi:hypothetical protein